MTFALPESLWAATACAAPGWSTLEGDASVDALVVGAGYTGLSAALHLARAGQDVAVVDAFEPGWGASGRNGGQIIAGLKNNPDELEAAFGQEKGARVTREFGAAADLVFSLIDHYRMDCQARRSGWIQAAHGAGPFEDLVKPRCAQWRARGVEARLLDAAETTAMTGAARGSYFGGWFDPRGGVLQPLSYARGLAAAAMSEGAKVYANASARAIHRAGSQWEIEFARGRIRAQTVILATNAHTDDLWPGLRRTVVPVTSFQLATAPLPALVRDSILPDGAGVADTRRLLLYFRLDHEGRLVMGGRSPVDDNPSFRDAGQLHATLKRLFPQAKDAPLEFVWSGRVAVTRDAMPHLHILAPGVIAALGCNGRGVAVCTMIGKIASELAQGALADEVAFPVTAPDAFRLHGLRKPGVFALSQFYRMLDLLETRR